MFLKKIINSIADAGKELLNKALPVQKNLETLLELCDDLISYKGVASGIAIAREISEISPWYKNCINNSGEDGTDHIINIIRNLKYHLNKKGIFIFNKF